MGLFSRKPPPPLPERADLGRALAALAPSDADRIRGKKVLAGLAAGLPADQDLRAVLAAVIESPSDQGLLWASPTQVGFVGSHSGVTVVPATAVRGAEVPFRGTLRVLYDPTVPGTHVTFEHDRIARAAGEPEGLDFSVRAEQVSLDFFCSQVRALA